jgi:hypothetical protein
VCRGNGKKRSSADLNQTLDAPRLRCGRVKNSAIASEEIPKGAHILESTAACRGFNCGSQFRK